MLQEGKKMIFTDFLHCNGYQNSCNVIHGPVQGKKRTETPLRCYERQSSIYNRKRSFTINFN